MANGWARDGAVQDQIEASIAEEVARVRSRLACGPSLTHCEMCEEKIPQARREALQGVRLCIHCQQLVDADGKGI